MGAIRNALNEGILGPVLRRFTNQQPSTLVSGNPTTQWSTGYDGGGYRRRLKGWTPSQYTTNTILTSSGHVLRARTRDVLRNNPHANAACESFVANLIGTGIKPSSLFTEDKDLREAIMKLWLDWTDECDADGIADLYGMQTIVARALFEAGECFIRYRNRRVSDDFLVPMQVQLLESDMCPYWMNEANSLIL